MIRLLNLLRSARRKPVVNAPRRPVVEVLEDRVVPAFFANAPFQVNPVASTGGAGAGATRFDFSETAAASNGVSVVVWERNEGGRSLLRAQRFNVAGQRLGAEIAVTNTPAGGGEHAVAMDARGNFVVTWEQFELVGGHTEIMAQRFSVNGTRLGGTITVADAAGDETDPRVAMDAAGNFIVTYQAKFFRDEEQTTPVGILYAVGYTAAGDRQGAIAVTTTPAGTFVGDSDVARAPDGRFAVAYSMVRVGSAGDGTNDTGDVIVRHYSAGGAPTATTTVLRGAEGHFDVDVSLDNRAIAAVAFGQTVTQSGTLAEVGRGVYSLLVAPNGARTGVVNVTARAGSRLGDVALNRAGLQAAVAWEVDGSVKVTEVKGTRLGLTTTLGGDSSEAVNRFFRPSIAARTTNQFLVTYTATPINSALTPAPTDILGRFGFVDDTNDPTLALGGAIPVNAVQTGIAAAVHTAANAYGRSVVVWTQTDNPAANPNRSIIRAQRFVGNQKLGQEIIVSGVNPVDLAGNVKDGLDVAIDAAGNFVVAWAQRDSAGLGNVFVRRYTSAGALRGPTNVVAASARDEFNPRAGIDAQGHFVVTYQTRYGVGNDVFGDLRGVRFLSSGRPYTGFTPFDGSASPNAFVTSSDVAMAPDGRFSVAYALSPGSLVVKNYTTAAALRVTQPILVNTGDSLRATIAVDDRANAVVAWGRSDVDAASGEATATGVFAMRVNATGGHGPLIFINGGAGVLHDVAINRTGGAFLVAWGDQLDTTGVTTVNLRLTEVRVSTPFVTLPVGGLDAPPQETTATLATGATGNFFVAYTVSPTGSPDTDVFARIGIY